MISLPRTIRRITHFVADFAPGLDIANRRPMHSVSSLERPNRVRRSGWCSGWCSGIILLAVSAIAGGAGSACSAITSVAVAGTDFGGATADAHCDRRYVTDGGQPAAFCQEVVATLAASQFADDCRDKHMATAGPGLCPRERIIAGCKLDEKHDDHSVAWDWYYDISNIESGDAGAKFEPPIPTDQTDVAALCADPARYSDGAELAKP